VQRPVHQPKGADSVALQQMVDLGSLAMRMKAYGDNMLCQINKTSKLFYARIPDNDVVLLMSSNSEMQSDFDEGNTFDIQRPHFDANFTFEAISEEIEAVLTAIVALTKCSKTWFLCKGTPHQIVKAASGDVIANARKLLNIFQNFHQIATELFISDFKEQQDWPAQKPGVVTLFSPSSVHHAGMPKLRENLKEDKPEFKLICQFALNSISDDKCILKIDNGTGFGQHKWTQTLVGKVMKPVVLKVEEENLNALSRQLQSQLKISYEDLVKFHKSYENTTNYEELNPVTFRLLERGSFSRSPCYFMKFLNPEKDFVGGNENAVSRVLNDLNKNFGRIFGYQKYTQVNKASDQKVVIHHPACHSMLKARRFVGDFKDCTEFTKDQFLFLSTTGAPNCCGVKWRSTIACLAELELQAVSDQELTTMMVMTSQFAQLARLSGEESWCTNNGLYLKDSGGVFAALLAIFKEGNQTGLDCVIDDNFSRWYYPSEENKIEFEEEDFKDAPIENEADEAFASSKRHRTIDEAAELAEAYAAAEVWKYCFKTSSQG